MPPNLLVILTDQHRNGALGADGDAFVRTPHLDALAARGVRFARSYCASPLCSPSRAAWVTGRTPLASGVTTNHQKLDPGLPTLGGVFRAAGYETVWAGKWHVPEEYPLERDAIPGFDNLPLRGRETDRNGYPVRVAGRPGAWEHNLGGYADVPVAEAAAAFLRRPHDRPFLLVVSLMNPHDICFPTAYDRAGPVADAELAPLPPNVEPPDGEADLHRETRFTHEWSATLAKGWDDLAWQASAALYHRFVGQADAAVGVVLDGLRAAGLEAVTPVVYTSDHGEGTPAHRWIGKLSLYEDAISVPFIVTRPGVTGGRVERQRPASGLDLFPTLCGLAGVMPPPGLHGTDLAPVIADPSASGPESAFCALYPVSGDSDIAGRAVRTTRWAYSAFSRGAVRETLFDLAADPGETRNLAGEPGTRPELDRHRGLLRDWLVKTGDPFPPPPVRD
ncbi:MAG: sulfatase-like hydrolase/transferase [Candidatus Coatesbacteria bacterium]